MRVVERILDPTYWAERLTSARSGDLHHAIFRCPLNVWRAIEAQHRRILSKTIGPCTDVFDVGCAWGRLLDMLPTSWRGGYFGLDISPDFVSMAGELHPGRKFAVGDLSDFACLDKFDLAICVSIRPMVVRNLGIESWSVMEGRIRAVASRILYLEYDVADEGALE